MHQCDGAVSKAPIKCFLLLLALVIVSLYSSRTKNMTLFNYYSYTYTHIYTIYWVHLILIISLCTGLTPWIVPPIWQLMIGRNWFFLSQQPFTSCSSSSKGRTLWNGVSPVNGFCHYAGLVLAAILLSVWCPIPTNVSPTKPIFLRLREHCRTEYRGTEIL